MVTADECAASGLPERLARKVVTTVGLDITSEVEAAVAVAIRAALDEAERVAEEADCEGPECGYCNCHGLAVAAVKALKG